MPLSRGRSRKTSHEARATVSKSMRERRSDARPLSRHRSRRHHHHHHHPPLPPPLPPPPLFGNLSSNSVQPSSVAPLGRVVRAPCKLAKDLVRATCGSNPFPFICFPSIRDSAAHFSPLPFPFLSRLLTSLFGLLLPSVTARSFSSRNTRGARG